MGSDLRAVAYLNPRMVDVFAHHSHVINGILLVTITSFGAGRKPLLKSYIRCIKARLVGVFIPRRQLATGLSANTSEDGSEIVPRYPPFDTGMPVVSIQHLLASQQALIRDIHISYGASQAEFVRLIRRPIENLAAYVHLLPASPAAEFRGAGGMFRFSLEVAYQSLQSSSAVLFSADAPMATRRELEPKWRYGCFLAGLCSELYRPLQRIDVLDVSGADRWQNLTSSLYGWATKGGHGRYFIRWKEPRQHRALSTLVLNQIIPSECFEYLQEPTNTVLRAVLNAVGDLDDQTAQNPIKELVGRAVLAVIQRDIKSNPELYGKVTVGAHLERYFVDVMRSLIRENPLWAINARKGRVWYARDGLFLVFPIAVKDMIHGLVTMRLPGVPQEPDTVVEMLASAGVITHLNSGSSIWKIQPPGATKAYSAIRIANPELVLPASGNGPSTPQLTEAVAVAREPEAFPSATQDPVYASACLTVDDPEEVGPRRHRVEPTLNLDQVMALPRTGYCDAAIHETLATILTAAATEPPSYFVAPEGVAVTLSSLGASGLNPTAVLKNLEKCGCAAELSNNRRVVRINYQSRALDALVLTQLGAKQLGFDSNAVGVSSRLAAL